MWHVDNVIILILKTLHVGISSVPCSSTFKSMWVSNSSLYRSYLNKNKNNENILIYLQQIHVGLLQEVKWNVSLKYILITICFSYFRPVYEKTEFILKYEENMKK
jgi:hypothetical protein